MLATTRWGSYLLPGPPYIGDLVILVLLADRVLALAGRGRIFAPNDTWTALTAGGLLVLSAIALLFGEHSVQAARDAAPFAYAILVFITPALAGERARKAGGLLTAALYLHLAWVSIALALPELLPSAATPGNSAVDVFSLRSDMDGLVNGLAASIGLYRLLAGRRGMLLFGWGLTLVTVMHSRSALLATAVMLLCVAGYASAQRTRGWLVRPDARRVNWSRVPRIRTPLALGALICVLAATFTVLAPTSIDRLTGTFGTPGNTHEEARAAGTTRARLDTWNALEGWVLDDRWRSTVGAGFGVNVMTASGAGVALVHTVDPDLRAPHNYLLGAWARLGAVGLTLVILLFIAGWRLMIKIRRTQMSDIDLLAALLLIGVPITAAVGVVMESPFGAIPYYWAIGHLSSMTTRQRADAS